MMGRVSVKELLLIAIAAAFTIFFGACSSGPDCWKSAYKSAFCQTLVILGKGSGSCDSLDIPERCWKEEADNTKMGYQQGVKDAENK